MLSTLGLTADQRAARRDFLGGSDANILMSGDIIAIDNLWMNKRGERPDDDLSGVLQVVLGAYTEPFNRAWFEKTTGRLVTNVGEERASLEHEFMGATLDGLTDGGETVFEAKHVSAFYKHDEVLAKYLPQLHHSMIVCEVERAVLSVLFGNHKHEVFEVCLDKAYAEQLLIVEQAFWRCVKTNTRPNAVEVKPPVPAVRRVDMQGSNAWAAAAVDWIAHKDAAKAFDDAAKAIRALVAEDVAEAHGHGLLAKRSKSGSILISQTKGDK